MEKAEGGEVTDPVISPKRNKSKTGQVNAENVEAKDVVAEVDVAFKQSFWHQDFNYRQYMEEHVPFAPVDEGASFHGKCGEMVEDAGSASL
jgi:hypothetical protein